MSEVSPGQEGSWKGWRCREIGLALLVSPGRGWERAAQHPSPRPTLPVATGNF